MRELNLLVVGNLNVRDCLGCCLYVGVIAMVFIVIFDSYILSYVITQ